MAPGWLHHDLHTLHRIQQARRAGEAQALSDVPTSPVAALTTSAGRGLSRALRVRSGLSFSV